MLTDPILPPTARYAEGFQAGLALDPTEEVVAHVTANRDRAVPGSGAWHNAVGLLTAMSMPAEQRAALRAQGTSPCCGQSVSRATPGSGPWSCDNCGKWV